MADTAKHAAAETGFVAVARVGDIPAGWVLRVRAGSREVALANCGGTIHALDHACTHAGGPLGDNRLQDGCLLECPWHGAVFDARTGQVRYGPARKPLTAYPVRVTGDVVLVAVS